MSYVVGFVGEKSSPFGAHGRKGYAHEVRSTLGEVPSPFGAHGMGAHRVRSMLGYVGEVPSPFGAHGINAHLVRSTLGTGGDNSTEWAKDSLRGYGGVFGLGDAASLQLAKVTKDVAIAEQSGNMTAITRARALANAVAAAINAQKAYDAKAVAIRQPLANMPKNVQDAAVTAALGPRPTIPTSAPVTVVTKPVTVGLQPVLRPASPAEERPTDGGAPPIVPPAVVEQGSNTMLYIGGAIALAVGAMLLKRG
jgi:hypothetical protein